MSETASKEQLVAIKEKLAHIEREAINDRGVLLRMRKAAGSNAQEIGALKKKVKDLMDRRSLAIQERNDIEREMKQNRKESEARITVLKATLKAAQESQVDPSTEVTDWKPVATWIETIDDSMIDVMRKALSARAKTLREETVTE